MISTPPTRWSQNVWAAIAEMGLRARAQWQKAGGEELVLVPSLNAEPAWADAVAAMARRYERASVAPARPALRVVD